MNKLSTVVKVLKFLTRSSKKSVMSEVRSAGWRIAIDEVSGIPNGVMRVCAPTRTMKNVIGSPMGRAVTRIATGFAINFIPVVKHLPGAHQVASTMRTDGFVAIGTHVLDKVLHRCK